MSVDDTFNRLRRIPLHEMTKIWFESPITLPGLWDKTLPVPPEVEKIFNKHHWTFLEWRECHTRSNGPQWRDPELDYD